MFRRATANTRVGRRLLSALICLLMGVSMVAIGMAAEAEADLVVLGKVYTREEIAAMEVTEHTHTRINSSGDITETEVRGVMLAELLADAGDDALIEFSTVDNWAGISVYTMTKSELAEQNALLAYEAQEDGEWVEYIKENEEGPGYFRLWVDGLQGAHSVNAISLAAPDEGPGSGADTGAAPDEWIGDATPEDHEIKITGLVDVPGYFTMEGLKEFAGDLEQTKNYSWINSSASTDIDTFSGVYIEDLLKELLGLDSFANGILLIASDGYDGAYFLNAGDNGVYSTDISGNKMMLAWNGTASRTDRDIIDYELPRLVVGQKNANDVNRSKWISDIIEIRVTAFGDLRGFYYAAPAIDALAKNGITDGVGNNRFDPAGNLTRAMFITLLGRALNKDAKPPSVEDRRFSDVDYGSWYGMHVEWAVDNGIVLGYEDGTFRPTVNLTVEHMLLMAERAGLTDIPGNISEAAENASRADAAIIIYSLMMQAG